MTKKFRLSLFLTGALFINGVVAPQAAGQEASALQSEIYERITDGFDPSENFNQMLQSARGPEFPAVLQYVFGESADRARESVEEDASDLFRRVDSATNEKVEERFENKIKSRREKLNAKQASSVRGRGFIGSPKFNWRAFAFGFRSAADEPKIDVRETGAQVSATGSDKKTVETENGTVTRSNKVETKAIDDGKTLGVEYKTAEIVEAKSKTENKSFRKETIVNWRVEIAACPDANGVVAGTATETIVSKNLITEPTGTAEITREINIQMQMKGYVNDDAEMTHYDMEGEVVETSSGFNRASERGLLKDAQKDANVRVIYNFRENKAGTTDSTDYGIVRTPAKAGKIFIKPGANTTLEDAKQFDKTSGKLIGPIWDATNSHYQRARSNWRNYGCVEVVCTAPKTKLKPGEEIQVTAEAAHKNEKTPVTGLLKGSGFEHVAPEEQRGSKGVFVLTGRSEGDNPSTITVESISKRGIGLGGLDFGKEKEKKEEPETECETGWTGTIKADRKYRQEREKRSGDNLAENGGYMETATSLALQLSGKRDRSEDATNVFFGQISGEQETVDFECDKYKVDEGYCGPNAVPYKAPLEKTRTSKTTGRINGEIRVYVNIDRTGGSINFSLPETLGKTVHSYVHKSACSYNDRANTNQAIDDGVYLNSENFSVSFPIDPNKQVISGSITVRDEEGTVTTYTYQLARYTRSKPRAQGGR